MGHRSQTHCKHGHAFTPGNTYFYRRRGKKRSERRCRTCTLERNKDWDKYKRTPGIHAPKNRKKNHNL